MAGTDNIFISSKEVVPEVEGTYVVYYTDEDYPCVDIMTWNAKDQVFEQEDVDFYNEDFCTETHKLTEITGYFKIPEPNWNKKSTKETITEFLRDNIDLSDEEFEKKFNEEFLNKDR